MKEKLDVRIRRVHELGLMWNEQHQSFVLEDFNVAMIDCKVLEDSQFDKMLSEIKTEMKRRVEAKNRQQTL